MLISKRILYQKINEATKLSLKISLARFSAFTRANVSLRPVSVTSSAISLKSL